MYKLYFIIVLLILSPIRKKNDLNTQIIFIYINEIKKYHIPLNSWIVLPLISNATELTS